MCKRLAMKYFSRFAIKMVGINKADAPMISVLQSVYFESYFYSTFTREIIANFIRNTSRIYVIKEIKE